MLQAFIERAPTGYQWTYEYDSDGSVIQKCLIDNLEHEGEIEQSIYKRIASQTPPSGYRWVSYQKQSPSKGPNVNTKLCVNRLGCPNGRAPNSLECVYVRDNTMR